MCPRQDMGILGMVKNIGLVKLDKTCAFMGLKICHSEKFNICSSYGDIRIKKQKLAITISFFQMLFEEL